MENNQLTDKNIPEEETSKEEYIKDPKKVAGGKAVQRKNAIARKLLVESTSSSSPPPQVESLSFTSIFDGVQKLALLLSAGFTIYHGWGFVKSQYQKNSMKSPVPDSPPVPDIIVRRRF